MAAIVASPGPGPGPEMPRAASVASQSSHQPRTFRRMVQDTLRVTGITRQRPRDAAPTPEPQLAQARPVASEHKPKEPSSSSTNSRGLRRQIEARVTSVMRSNRHSGRPSAGNANAADEPIQPFVAPSLRQASLSSPALNFFGHNSSASRNHLSNAAMSNSSSAALATPSRPIRIAPAPRSSRDRDSAAASSRNNPSISRPRSLLPSSPSTPSLGYFPETPTRRTSRRERDTQSPTRGASPSPLRSQNRSPPLRPTRHQLTSSSTSHLPSSGRSPTAVSFTSRQDVVRSTSPVTRALSPTYASRNTSSASLAASSPHREAIRTASSILVKQLARPPPHVKLRDWDDVEIRLRALTRLERIWGKSGGGGSSTALGSSSGHGGGEERERRLFCEATRDGYVLCALLNKYRPGTVARPDPKEDGFAKTANVTKFLAGALLYGVPNSDLFFRDDFLEGSGESLARVAQTIIALARLAEPMMIRPGSRGNYPLKSEMSFSTPNLLDTRSRSPKLVKQHRRDSPPSPGPSSGQLAGLKFRPTSPSGAKSSTQYQRGSESPVPSKESQIPAIPPPRSPLRPNMSRASISSSITESTTGFSLLDNRASTRYGTMRTMTTEATSILPSETSSVHGARIEAKPASQDVMDETQSSAYQTQYTELPLQSRRRSYDRDAAAARLAAATAQISHIENLSTRPRRERKSSDLILNDLSNVEEVDEMGTRRGRPLTAEALFDPLLSDSTTSQSQPRRPSLDLPGQLFDTNINKDHTEHDITTSPPKTTKPSLPLRRPVHGHRHSVDTVSSSFLAPRRPSLSREREPSPALSRDSSTPSPQMGGNRPVLAPRDRSSSRPSPRASYVPKLNGTDDSRGPYRQFEEGNHNEPNIAAASAPSLGIRVPFPRATSGDYASRLSALPASSETLVPEEGAGTSRSPSLNVKSGQRPIYRGRFHSELDPTQARKPRPNSFDDGGVRPGRSRFESMVNLGAAGEVLTRESSFNAVRQPLIVREEGKQPMHYQIGNGIGRGQFGAVYRALNLNTGQMVAVKRIGLQGLSEDEISNLMKEVEVLKRLSHPSIVKYHGMVRATDTLSIVLEYVENGSLGQTLKAFGKLNERLVASYMVKILEGLHYLHSSHVVHCDLKAANILTTKNGNVKLSDFGVSLNLHAKALEEIRNDVAGTPNWMAPEVIELKGASPASDIWSLACTAIELLTGHPPYHEIHNGLSVMFRIVEDPMPPIPETCSEPMKDFLRLCFKKNPADRPSAEVLFEHPWLRSTWGEHKELRLQDSVPQLRKTSLSIVVPKEQSPESPRQLGDHQGRMLPGSPLASPISPESLESASSRQHSFIKTTFGRAVTCRVCQQSVKRSAVLCETCGLIAHARCAADAPPSCDIRTQLLLYAQYSQASFAQEVNTPSVGSSTPITIPSSPMLPPRGRRSSDAAYSGSPPKFSERILGWKKKSPDPPSPSPLPREETPTPTPTPVPMFRGANQRPGDVRVRSRLSMTSNANTDSMRSAGTNADTITSSSATNESVSRSPRAGTTQIGTNKDSTIDSRRVASRLSGASGTISDSEERRRIRRPRDSQSSRSSQCIIQ